MTYDDELKPECQVECTYGFWERTWSFYDMIADNNKVYLDPMVKVVMEQGMDDDKDGSRKHGPLIINVNEDDSFDGDSE